MLSMFIGVAALVDPLPPRRRDGASTAALGGPGGRVLVLAAVTPWALVAGTPLVVLFAIPLLPAGITVAILRHGLLDVRLVLARGVAYLLLSGLVLAGYALLVAGPLGSRLRTARRAAGAAAAGPPADRRRAAALRRPGRPRPGRDRVGGALHDLSAGARAPYARRYGCRTPPSATSQGAVARPPRSPCRRPVVPPSRCADGHALEVGLRAGRATSGAR